MAPTTSGSVQDRVQGVRCGRAKRFAQQLPRLRAGAQARDVAPPSKEHGAARLRPVCTRRARPLTSHDPPSEVCMPDFLGGSCGGSEFSPRLGQYGLSLIAKVGVMSRLCRCLGSKRRQG